MSITITQPQTSITGTIRSIEYASNGDRIIDVTFTNPSDQQASRRITIKADGSVVDWRGVVAYTAGQANARLSTLNTLLTNLESDLASAVTNGKIVSPFA